ncbi:hypothetical protein VE03_09526 [Pseudogymnoascus sp. 23342-1-I1]|nr:hypothetical protein VE03_09526 [Pseudogymnoascus sp. 23342-1-I1]
MIAATYISPLILGLALFNVVTGAAINSIKNPKVIPGPGLPSLKELGITSEDLYKMGRPDSSVKTPSIQARFEPKCGPSDNAYVNVNGIIACYNYLKNVGDRNCATPSGLGVAHFCYSGEAEVSGQSYDQKSYSSKCHDVADAVLWSVDHCTRADQLVAGFQAATGNGNLIVGSTSKQYIGR